MCDAIGGGMSKTTPPVQQIDQTTQAGGAQTGTVASATGGGIVPATQAGGGAASLGSSPLAIQPALTALVEAIKALVAALGTNPVAGGGAPGKFERGAAPGKVEAGGPLGLTNDPVEALRRWIVSSRTDPNLTDAQRAAMAAFQPRVDTLAAGAASRRGFNPVDLGKLNVEMGRATGMFPVDKAPQVDALLARYDRMAAVSRETGRFDPIELRAASEQLQALRKPSPTR